MINSMFAKGNIPLLEKAASFAYQRHVLIANNIANATTPGYKAQDLPEKAFQAYLEDAVAQRDKRAVKYVEFNSASGFTVEPGSFTVDAVPTPDPGVMSHNGNNVDVDKENAKMAKNALYYNLVLQLLNNSYESLKSAIAEKV